MARALVWVVLLLGVEARAERWLELQLIPISAQVNVLASEQAGSGGRATYHFNRFIGVYVGGLYNWHSTRSAVLDSQHLTTFRLRGGPLPAQPVATWQLHAGVESIPLTGTFSLGEKLAGGFGLVVSLGLGPGGTRFPLQDVFANAISYPDAGVRLMGHLGLGARFSFGPFAVLLGMHASMWSSVVTRLAGCGSDDLRAQIDAQRAGEDPALAPVTAGCRFAPAVGPTLALQAIQEPDRGLQVNLAAELGLSWSL